MVAHVAVGQPDHRVVAHGYPGRRRADPRLGIQLRARPHRSGSQGGAATRLVGPAKSSWRGWSSPHGTSRSESAWSCLILKRKSQAHQPPEARAVQVCRYQAKVEVARIELLRGGRSDPATSGCGRRPQPRGEESSVCWPQVDIGAHVVSIRPYAVLLVVVQVHDAHLESIAVIGARWIGCLRNRDTHVEGRHEVNWLMNQRSACWSYSTTGSPSLCISQGPPKPVKSVLICLGVCSTVPFLSQISKAALTV